VWQRASTNERNLTLAKQAAKELMVEAEIRLRSNLPVITRRFRDVAKLAIKRMEEELAAGKGKTIFNDYIRVTKDYLLPALGNRSIAKIDTVALDELDAWRIAKLGKIPSHSTVLTHNAALNRIFDEAVDRKFLTETAKPKLDTKSRTGDRRPAFSLVEVRALLGNFDGWISAGRHERSREMRTLLRDYVEALLDTGARPGKELLDLRWNQIQYSVKPTSFKSTAIDEDGNEIDGARLNPSVELTVTGKTGRRQTLGMSPTVQVLKRLAKRNYDVAMPVATPLINVAKPKNNQFVFRLKANEDGAMEDASHSFQKMFQSYLEEHGLLIDPITQQKRVLYSLRHTYATFRLTHDKVPIHTLAEQMGTSVGMIEKHYSHLKVKEAEEQLRAENTNRLLSGTSVIDEAYKSTRKPKAKKRS
jgi:integrase